MMHPQVPVLLGPRQPSTIGRFVIPEGVDPVKREPVRAWSHVCEEGREVVTPFVAHGDATTAVKTEIGARLGVAAALHVAPRSVFSRLCAALAAAVGHAALGAVSALHAAATARVAVREVFAHLHGFCAAVTATAPEASWVVGPRLAVNYYQFAEDLPRQVECRHSAHYTRSDVSVKVVIAHG